ncbi:MAG: hypothetical protein IH885_05480, partial [Myxococcales bacterium]|nr:hypothetical protein [Myxococcales bacterium]
MRPRRRPAILANSPIQLSTFPGRTHPAGTPASIRLRTYSGSTRLPAYYYRSMLIDETKRAVDALGLNGRSVLVAASGGLDSNALVHALLEIAGGKLLKLSIGHVNHGLRGEESEADQQAVLQLADGLGLPAFSRRVDPEQLRVGRSSRERPTLQEAAR